ncbi:SemiSWEET family sugar transporter [Chloroflexota bacterium]
MIREAILVSAEYLGLSAGVLTTCSMIPQLIRVFKLKSAREISILFTSLFLTGVICWMVYGIVLRLPSVIIWNAIMAILITILLYAKLRYGR